jgi:dipeptidyl aminopeptidase/acylaminoacyl peptidase
MEVLDEQGREQSRLAILPGLDGGLAVSRDGTRFAYVNTARYDPPADLPASLRKRLARRPQSTLDFGSFLSETQVEHRNGVGFSEAIGRSPSDRSPVFGRPAWSPDGRRVVYAAAQRGRVHLYVMRIDSAAEPQELTSGAGRDLDPRWSPDGRTIVFERLRKGDGDVYSVRLDGSGLRDLTGWFGQETMPDWSPDGRSLVFASNRSGRFQLYRLSGGRVARLTNDYGNDTRPVWSPDGRWIAFSSDRTGANNVYLIDPQGGHEHALTRGATEYLVQDWQPVHDVRPPTIRALPSSGPSGKPPNLRYVVSDDAPRVRILGDIAAVGGDSRSIVRPLRGRVRTLTADLDELSPFDDPNAVPPSRFRFCLTAVDPTGNASPESCSTFRFDRG